MLVAFGAILKHRTGRQLTAQLVQFSLTNFSNQMSLAQPEVAKTTTTTTTAKTKTKTKQLVARQLIWANLLLRGLLALNVGVFLSN